MTHCPGDSSGLDHWSFPGALFPEGQRAGQVSQGSEAGKGRAWTEGLRRHGALLKKGLTFWRKTLGLALGAGRWWGLRELRRILRVGIYTAGELGW